MQDDWEDDEEGSPLPDRTDPDPSSIQNKPRNYMYGSSDEEDEEGEGGAQGQLQVTTFIDECSVSSQVVYISVDGTSVLWWDNIV